VKDIQLAKTFDEYLIASMCCLLLAFAVCTLIFGCATVQTKTVPTGCEDSVIYKNVPTPELVGVGLVIAMSEAARQYPQAKPYIINILSALTNMLSQDKPTYAGFALKAAENIAWVNDNFGARLVLLQPIIYYFDSPLPISACDLALIRNHLAMQKAALASY